MPAIEALREKFRAIHNLNHAYQYLSWDEAVMMPDGGGPGRAEALATLRKLVHEMITDSSMGDILEEAQGEATESDWDRSNLRVIARQRTRALAIPTDLVVAMSRASSACEQLWREKRKENDWESVKPLLAEVIRLNKHRAAILGEKLNADPYDALLDEYEPGLTQSFIDPIFEDLLTFLPGFIDDVLSRQGPQVKCQGDFSESRQLELAKRLMKPLGFNFGCGRIDTSHHPFSAGESTDTRITTRFSSDDFLESMCAVIHETGHALYQQGLPREWHDQPVGNSLGMMVHESQSLFMEMQVCRGNGFLEFALPIINECFNMQENGSSWNLENLANSVRRVARGKIRVEADELTYPLHVILRYQIEQAVLRDQLTIDDIPGAWNDAMRRFFGIELGNDYHDGCMQDVHWFAGLLGYFPCYSLGALTAAQFYRAMIRDVPGIEEDFPRGKFDRVLSWLRSNIHSQGQLIPSFELIEKVTGLPLGSQSFIDHAQARYGTLNQG